MGKPLKDHKKAQEIGNKLARARNHILKSLKIVRKIPDQLKYKKDKDKIQRLYKYGEKTLSLYRNFLIELISHYPQIQDRLPPSKPDLFFVRR